MPHAPRMQLPLKLSQQAAGRVRLGCTGVLVRGVARTLRVQPHLRDPRDLALTPILTLTRVLYDLTELENAARFKKGETERTVKKVDNVNKWFVKLDTDLNTLLAYLK